MKYFIYHGYISPDNYGNSDCYDIKTCNTQAEVLAFKKVFDENVYDECSDVAFRIFQGNELFLQPKEIFTEYELIEMGIPATN